ncbi:hypothetical protein SARC_02910 [Sphaeroforma arctica JP610]|uniref:Phosphatidylinositol-specific phospholipase C X domain-containing protein n=1 Tax=Sphaeroforma arctica JP610 TaxID=667725 RepID=A0A0L0G7L2_9EUKA|nr:hypothetical protein SARC_02910 [Sphaeroforma arctica JP610]KNC84871.1 hypothetical protein SARC_02910 [Sphaeroforma arctica JP610]|eukprot:XP_014158773.1 hypothetical protein SARC_02910 [Sphaeroforma arctica JP610]
MTTSYGSIADSPRAQSINDTSQEHILPTVRVSATSRNVLTNAPLFHNTRSHGRGWVCRIAQCVAMLSVVVALVLVWARVQLYMGMASMNYRPECVATIANESATVAVQENLMTAEVVTMVTANPSVEYQSWMSDHYFQIQNRTLADLLLPGTHDSAGYRLLGGTLYNIDPLINILVRAATALHLPLEKMIVKWSQTQSVNIYQQLIGGVRYLDLRTVWDGRIWRIYHGVAGDPLTSILNSIISFQDNHRNEVLVIELAVYSGSHGGDVCALARLVKAKLGRFLLDGSHNLANTTIGSMVCS